MEEQQSLWGTRKSHPSIAGNFTGNYPQIVGARNVFLKMKRAFQIADTVISTLLKLHTFRTSSVRLSKGSLPYTDVEVAVRSAKY